MKFGFQPKLYKYVFKHLYQMKRPLGKLLNRTSGGLGFFGRFLQKFLVILVGIDFYMSFGDRI